MERPGWDAEVERSEEVQPNRDRREQEADADPDPVEEEARLVRERRLDGVGLDLVSHQAVLGRVAYERGERESERQSARKRRRRRARVLPHG
jgi:hypothetical protein